MSVHDDTVDKHIHLYILYKDIHMATSFASLRKSSKSQFETLGSELQKLSNPQGANTSQEDGRFWKPEVDKTGNGFAVIRFLPAPAGEDIPFVRIFDHAFQGPTGQWYIEKSLTTLGEQDPVSEYNKDLWATGTEANKDQVRKQKRRLSFVSNIYVVSDPKHPENEGKVFLYRYGKKIFDKLSAAMEPEFEDESPLNPFDLWEGANFKLKIRKVEGYQNYDKSEFDAPTALFEDDDEMEAIWKQEHALQSFLDRSNFKSYDMLKARLYKTLGLDGSAPKAAAKAPWDEEETAPPPVAKAAPAKAAASKPAPNLAEDDEDMSFFQSLADD